MGHPTQLAVLSRFNALVLATLVGAAPALGCGQSIPPGATRLDGRISPGEWDSAAAHELSNGGRALVRHEAGDLWAAVEGTGEGWAHLYIQQGDTARVLHASAALGTATYVRDAAGGWSLVEPFVWGVRDTSFSPEAEASQSAFFAEQGWVANTNGMGTGRTLEFRVAAALLGPSAPRLAALVASDPTDPHYWPGALTDATLDAELIRGDAPDRLSFVPESWAALEAEPHVALAFENVAVIPMDSERVLRAHTVVVEGDRIVAVGPSGEVEVPAGATRVDGRGQYLIPGLAEMHGHVPPPSAPPALTEETLFLYLSQGITTVRGMLGAEGQLDLKARANGGDLLSPTLYLAGPSFNGNSVSSPEQAAEMVRQQAEEGWDLLKVHPGLTLPEYDAMAETANDLGIRFGGHVPADVGLRHALEMGQETYDHVDGYVEALDGESGPVDEAALAEIVRLSREAGAWIVPTMALWEVIYGTLPLDGLTAYPELVYVSPEQVQRWTSGVQRYTASANPEASRNVIENRIRILRALHEGGVRILMGTDAPQLFSVPGFSLHREFPRMTAAGMTPYEILKSGTANVGDYFSNEDTFGLVAEGHRADLVLLDADPLADVANLQRITGVMVRGRWVPRAELDQRLDAIRDAYADQ